MEAAAAIATVLARARCIPLLVPLVVKRLLFPLNPVVTNRFIAGIASPNPNRHLADNQY
jgi:hypothetical protein